MTKRTLIKPSPTRSVGAAPSPTRRVDPKLIEQRLGAEQVAARPVSGSQFALDRLRLRLAAALRSSGGRPGLEGVSRRPKVPMTAADWSTLESIANELQDRGVSVTAGQVAAQLLHDAIEEHTARRGCDDTWPEYPPLPPSQPLRIAESTPNRPPPAKAWERERRAALRAARDKVAA